MKPLIGVQVLLDAVVRVPVLLLVTAAVVNLHEAHAALDEPSRDETLPTERRRPERDRMIVLRIVQPIHLLRRLGCKCKIPSPGGHTVLSPGLAVPAHAGGR